MDRLVWLSLRSLLLTKIYPMDVSLVRNDSKAAALIFEYVAKVSNQVESDVDSSDLSFEKANKFMHEIQPLVDLSQGTIRKYIAELWREHYSLSNRIRFDFEETDKFDVRQFDGSL